MESINADLFLNAKNRTMKHRAAILLFFVLLLNPSAYSQGVHNMKTFTKYDLYKWRQEMNFTPKYFSPVKVFDDFLLGDAVQELIPQYYVSMTVNWEGYKNDKSSSEWYAFRSQITEYYGPLSDEWIERWYMPLYVFLELDKWAKGYSKGHGITKKY